MTFPELDKKLTKTVKDVQNFHNGTLMEIIAIEAFTLLRGRVQETGVNAHGQKYKPYSTKDMLVGCKSFKKSVCSALLGSKEKRKQLEWKTIGGSSGYTAMLAVSSGEKRGEGVRLAVLKGGYKKWRELQLGAGKGDIVNFSVTNEMWNNIMSEKPKASELLSTKADHMKGIAIIGAHRDSEKKKLEGNTKRRGDILDLSQKEIDGLMSRYNLQVLKIFKENGL